MFCFIIRGVIWGYVLFWALMMRSNVSDAKLTNEVRDRRENATEDAMPKNT